VAAMISADTLVLLSDIDGLYTADPHFDPKATVVPEVDVVTPEIEAMAGKARVGDSSGGMVTKLAAAKVCLANGCRMVIADGRGLHPLRRIEKGETCTWFLPSANPQAARKRWIAGALKIVGTIVVDGGAVTALRQGRSLLPAGVIAIEGRFQKGDAVAVKTADGREIGRGLSGYSADDGRRIMGRRTSEIENILGYQGRDEMIHRDNLVLS